MFLNDDDLKIELEKINSFKKIFVTSNDSKIWAASFEKWMTLHWKMCCMYPPACELFSKFWILRKCALF